VNERSYKRLDDLLKGGIVIFAVLTGYVIGRNSAPNPVSVGAASTTTVVGNSESDPIGHVLSLPGLDWSKSQKTLVLALQTGCHFCSESGPFYQQLLRERAEFGSTRFVAVLPQSVQTSTTYLKKLGVAVDEVRQGSLTEIGVRGTPTLLIVNGSGVVSDAWYGRLQRLAEDEVVNQLKAK